MKKPGKPDIVLAVTLGDPGGIGPETALKAAFSGRRPRHSQLVLVGDRGILRRYSKLLRLPLPPPWQPPDERAIGPGVVNWDPPHEGKNIRRPSRWKPGTTGKAEGLAASQWIRSAVAGCRAGWFDGMVTGPACKKSLSLAQVPFPGQTEYLAHLTGARSCAMMLIGGRLRVIPATRHVSISGIPEALTREKVVESVRLASLALAWFRSRTRLIGVCALNPHGGEQGLLGTEETDIIIPALRQVRKEGLHVEGPVPADVIFHMAARNRYGAIVAMYHDQGLAPLKMMAFERGVNLTLGLPVIRTSPDHGVGLDIAGRGTAHPGSMIEAIRLAARLSKRQNPF